MTALLDRFERALGTRRGATVKERTGHEFTGEQLSALRAMRDRGPVLTRRPNQVFDSLVKDGFAYPFKDYGGRSYGLTIAGYELTGRRIGNGLTWQVVGGTLGDDGAWPREPQDTRP